jgi:hypothetical protein
MWHHKRNFKHILFFLFFYLLFLIYQCYGTELKCSCERNSVTFCQACEENLNLYSHDQKSTNKNITNTEVGEKYEENTISSDIFYEEYEKQLSVYCHDQKVQTNMMQTSEFVKIIKACKETLSTDPYNQKSTNENDTNDELCKKYQENEISPKTFDEPTLSEENLNLYSQDQKNTNKTDTNFELCQKYKENSITPEIVSEACEEKLNFYCYDQKMSNKDDDNLTLWESLENSINSETLDKACDENLNLYSHDQKFTTRDDANVEFCEKHQEKPINPETVYAACKENLSLDNRDQKNTKKYDANYAICEKCEENLENYGYQHTMDMKSQTLCARCSVEYLSYYFFRNRIETTKLCNFFLNR